MENWEILFGKGAKPAESGSTDDWAEDDPRPATVTPSRVTPPTAADATAGDEATALGDFRSTLGTRREADELLAAAIEVRQRALAEAEEIVRHAEALALEIEKQARAHAERAVAEADLLREQARSEAMAERAQYLADVDAQAGRTILRLETLADDVDRALERAKDDLVETMLPLAELRSDIPVDSAALVDEAEQNHSGHEPDRRRNPFRTK